MSDASGPRIDPVVRFLSGRRARVMDLFSALLVCGPLLVGVWLLLTTVAASPGTPPSWLAFGLLSLAAILALSFKGFTSARSSQRFITLLKRAILILLAAVLTLYPLLRLPVLGRVADFSAVFIAWALAILFYALAFAMPTEPAAPASGAWRSRRSRWSRWSLLPRWRVGKGATTILIGITLCTALLRLWDLGSIPYLFLGDESAFGLRALATATGELGNPFTTDWLSQPTLGMFFEGLALRFTGSTIEGARLPWALLGTLTIPVTFCLASRIRGTTVGLVTAALLAVYHFHIHYSRMALNNIADPFFIALAVLCLLIATENKNLFAWVLVGACCGLALYFYQGARLTPLILAVVIAFFFFRHAGRLRPRLLIGTLVASGSFLVVAAPMLQYAVRFPADFNARVDQVSIFKPGWLSSEIIRTGMSGIQILWEQFRRAALAFNVYPDTSPNYHLQTPLLDPFFGLLFLTGLICATLCAIASRRYWRLFPIVVWWWSGMVVGGALTLSPPASQRLITLAVPVCFLIAFALELVVSSVRQMRLEISVRLAYAAAVLLFSVISLKTYFFDYLPLNLEGGPPDPVVRALVPKLKALDPGTTVYFAGAPVMYWGHSTILYLAPQARGQDLLQPLTRPPSADLIQPGHEALFVFLPDRIGDLSYVRQTFPIGTIGSLTNPGDERVVATLYEVTR